MGCNAVILKNGLMKIFKWFIRGISIAVCAVFTCLLILVFIFKFRICEIMSNSQSPMFTQGDIVITKPCKEYRIGDVVLFNINVPIIHRLIAVSEDGKIFYCHGDNEPSVVPSDKSKIVDWKENSSYLQGLIEDGTELTNVNTNMGTCQVVSKSQVQGKVVFRLKNVGTVFKFVRKYIILILVGVLVFVCWLVKIKKRAMELM